MNSNNQPINSKILGMIQRQPSPTSLEAAAELIRFVSQNSEDKPPPTLAPASLVALPAAFGPMMQYRDMAPAAVARPLSNITADGSLHSDGRKPILNRAVDHTYTDYAPVSEEELRELDQICTVVNDLNKYSPEKRRLMQKLFEMPISGSGRIQSFPRRLHEVVSNPKLSEIISWMPHGRSFVIHDPDALVERVLPTYFNQTKFVSFVRQLNLWGFKRVTREVEGKSYYHELFLRGRPYMVLRIKRHKIKGHGFKLMPNPDNEPNFYSYTHVDGRKLEESSKIEEEDASTRKPLLKEEKEIRSKKKIMLSRASAAAATSQIQTAGVMGILSEGAPRETPQAHYKRDNRFLSSAIAEPRAPPAAAAGYTESLTQPRLASNAGYAAESNFYAAHYAALMQLTSNARSAVGIPQCAVRTTQNRMDDMLSQRLAQLKREQEKIEMLRSARMLEELSTSRKDGVDPYQYLFGFGASAGKNLAQSTHNPCGFPSVPRADQAGVTNSLHMHLSEAIRKTEHLEEFANVSRNRARVLALAGVMESQMGYDAMRPSSNGN